MDGFRFDELTRALPGRLSRRRLGGLGGGFLGALGLAAISPADLGAKKKKRKKSCKRVKCPACRSCKKGKCKPLPNESPCGPGSACQNGACVCAEACCTNAQCPDPANPVCVDFACAPCTSSGQCAPADAVCVEGACVACDVVCNGDPDECGDALQDAIADGGVIHVCPGRYRGNFVVIEATPALTLIGAGDGDGAEANTILDADGLGRPFTIPGGIEETVTLRQLRLTGGQIIGPGGDPKPNTIGGGGIDHRGAELQMTDCAVVDNEVVGSGAVNNLGGGIFSGNDSTLTMTRCTVSDNYAESVSGESFGSGGGLRIDGAATLTDCLIADNRADNAAGGINIGSAADVTLTGSTVVERNEAPFGGGIFDSGGGVLEIGADCRVRNNTATFGGGSGGGIRTSAGSVVTLLGDDPSPIVVDNCDENCAGPVAVAKCAAGGGVCP